VRGWGVPILTTGEKACNFVWAVGKLFKEKTTFVHIDVLKQLVFHPRREPRRNHENAGSNMKMVATMRYSTLK
jgi:hypothetical protein